MTRGKKPPALPWWEHLEQLRLREGWSRTQLATKAGVARTTIDAWKTAPRAPLNTTITEVAARLEIDRDEALWLAGITRPQSEDEDPSDRLDRLYEEWKADPARRDRLASVLESGDAETDPEKPDEAEPGEDEADPTDLDRLYRQWRDDRGERGAVLRGLLKSWDSQEAG